jgi:hypothetical protein
MGRGNPTRATFVAGLSAVAVFSGLEPSFAKGTHVECHLNGITSSPQPNDSRKFDMDFKFYLDDTNEQLINETDGQGLIVTRTTLYSDTTINAEIGSYYIAINRMTGTLGLMEARGSYSGSGTCHEITAPVRKF